MNMSFYTAALGAAGQQEKMNVIANNIANVNTDGFRSKNAVFSDLMYYNMRDEQGADTRVKAGSGIAWGVRIRISANHQWLPQEEIPISQFPEGAFSCFRIPIHRLFLIQETGNSICL